MIAAAAAGEARAAAAIDEVADWTGVGLRAIVNIFNPQAIVLGGVLAQVWMARHDVMTRSMSATTLHALLEQVRVMPAALGDDSSLMGAAEMAFEPVLADPLGAINSREAHPA